MVHMPTEEELQILQTLHERITNLENLGAIFGNDFENYKKWIKGKIKGILRKGEWYNYIIYTNHSSSITLYNSKDMKENLDITYKNKLILITYNHATADPEPKAFDYKGAVKFTTDIVNIWINERKSQVNSASQDIIDKRKNGNVAYSDPRATYTDSIRRNDNAYSDPPATYTDMDNTGFGYARVPPSTTFTPPSRTRNPNVQTWSGRPSDGWET